MPQYNLSFLDSTGNPITPSNYLSERGHIYKIMAFQRGLKYIHSGNFKKPYKFLTPQIASLLTPIPAGLESKLMPIFNMLDPRKRK